MLDFPREIQMTIFSLAFSIPTSTLQHLPLPQWPVCVQYRRVMDELHSHPWFTATSMVYHDKPYRPSDVRYLYLTGLGLDTERVYMERTRRFHDHVRHKWVGHGHWAMPVTILVDPVRQLHILIQDRLLLTWHPRTVPTDA